eukprot:1156301-Pelagomonas_calceolata.AAC.1
MVMGMENRRRELGGTCENTAVDLCEKSGACESTAGERGTRPTYLSWMLGDVVAASPSMQQTCRSTGVMGSMRKVDGTGDEVEEAGWLGPGAIWCNTHQHCLLRRMGAAWAAAGARCSAQTAAAVPSAAAVAAATAVLVRAGQLAAGRLGQHHRYATVAAAVAGCGTLQRMPVPPCFGAPGAAVLAAVSAALQQSTPR